MDGATFFSPFPAYADSNRFDPEFRQASARFYPTKTPDDFMWLLWSNGKMTWEILRNAGKDLTREGLMYDLERMRNIKNGIAPGLSYSPNNHFGADEVHVSEVRCSDRMWHTVKSFVSDF